ncbi:MAG: hypothetical protein IT271_12580 [Chitinophagales bacterium]|nr:hypothetical protein [Chitinophagales bacterium]
MEVKELSEGQLAAIRAIDAKVKQDVDALPNDIYKFAKIQQITKAAMLEKNAIKNPTQQN